MDVMTGKVVDGKIVVEDVDLEEGTQVTILAPGDEEGFHLSPEQRKMLLESIEASDQGRVVEGWQLLKQLESDR